MERFATWAQKHWVGILLAALATALGLFAAMWPIFTRDTVPEFLEKRGMIVETYRLAIGFAAFCLTASFLVLAAILYRFSKRPMIYVGAGMPPASRPPDALPRGVEWVSSTERKAAEEAKQPKETASIPEGHFSIVEKRDKQGHLHLQIQNLKEEPKTGYTVNIVDVKVWSELLNEGVGGFAQCPAFVNHKKPIRCVESGGTAGRLDHVEPKRFELIRNPGIGPWVIRGADGAHLTIDRGIWRFRVELQWNGGIKSIVTHLRLNTAGATKTADFVSQAISE
jgi:hypothetical protein